jgi:hypothetical protein
VLDGWPLCYAWKKNGNAWGLRMKEEHGESEAQFVRLPILDKAHWRVITYWTLLRDDGTLWFWDGALVGTLGDDRARGLSGNSQSELTLVQVGAETNWVDAIFGSGGVMARKTDGSLWKWDWRRHHGEYIPESSVFSDLRDTFSRTPVRLGIHSDWIALDPLGGDTVSLAADGSLWSWPDTGPAAVGYRDAYNFFLTASRKPSRIENILGVGK